MCKPEKKKIDKLNYIKIKIPQTVKIETGEDIYNIYNTYYPQENCFQEYMNT